MRLNALYLMMGLLAMLAAPLAAGAEPSPGGQRRLKRGIVRFALRSRYSFFVVALLILFLGFTAFRSMPSDIFRPIDIPVVTVIWQEAGLSTPEMEQRVSSYSHCA